MENFENSKCSNYNLTLNKYYTKDKNTYTNTRMGNNPGKFYINKDQYDNFLKQYTNHVFFENNEEFLTEKHEDIGPFVIDLDLKYELSENIERKYSIEHIKKFIQLYISKIEQYCDFESDKERWAFVFEKSTPQVSNDCIKDGIHIMFPYLTSDADLQYIIRDEVLVEMGKIFDELELIKTIDKNENTPYSNVLDKAVIKKNGWLLYGSVKQSGSEPYKLTRIFEAYHNYCDEKENKYSPLSLVKLLSIRNHNFEIKVKNEMLDIIKEKSKKYAKPEVNINVKMNKKNMKKSQDIETVRKLVTILSSERAKNFHTWIEVGWCLHNIDYRLLPDWIQFSKKVPEYANSADKECSIKWGEMLDEGLNIGSLHRWCQEDNLEAYNDIMSKDLNKLILESLNLTTTDISKVVYNMFKHEFRCVSLKHGIWFQFMGKWKELDKGVSLRKKISNDVVNAYLKLSSYYADKARQFDDMETIKENNTNLSSNLNKVSLKLRNATFKDTLMKECAEVFWQEGFLDTLDENIYLIGFENGVYDLNKINYDTGEYGMFRPGRPEDNISMSTGIDYVSYNEDDPYIQEIKTFMEQILPDEDKREYVLKTLASFLDGTISEEKFHIWTGTGGNGKSKLIELFMYAFGDYCCNLPVTILTQKRASSNAATPELARTKGKRFAILQEPDEDERINVGLMKELSGGDKIVARGLYKEPVEFKPQFKMILTCNRLPKVPHDDGGTWRRLRVIDYQSEFVDDPDPEKPNQFPIDYNLSNKLKIWAPSFMSLLLKYYSLYRKEGVKEPKDVLDKTKKYRCYNDMYSEFANEKIIENPSGTLKIKEAYDEFKYWYKDNYNDNKCPKNKEFKTYLDKTYGINKSKPTEIKGISLKPDDDDPII